MPLQALAKTSLRMFWVHADGENVGVVNQAGGNRMPGSAAVGGFPGQVRRSGVEHVGIGRIERQSGDVLHLRDRFQREILRQVAPRSAERKTPFEVPAAMVPESIGDSASDSMRDPRMPAKACQVSPPSLLS